MVEYAPDEESLAEVDSERERVRLVAKRVSRSRSVEWIAETADADEEVVREECERLAKRFVLRRIGDDRYDVRLWVVYLDILLRRLRLRR